MFFVSVRVRDTGFTILLFGFMSTIPNGNVHACMGIDIAHHSTAHSTMMGLVVASFYGCMPLLTPTPF